MTTVGQLIRDRARVLHQSDEAVARILDVSSSTVTRWRQEKIAPQRNKIPALAAWLGVSEDEVYAALRTEDGPTLSDLAVSVRSLTQLVGQVEQRLSEVEAAVRPARPATRRSSPASSS